MKDSIARYMETHASASENLPGGWVKKTFQQDEPTLMGQLTDVCQYSHADSLATFTLYAEEDAVDIECFFPEEVLPYDDINELIVNLETAVATFSLEIVTVDTLPPLSCFSTGTYVLLDQGKGLYSAYFADPEHSQYYDLGRNSDSLEMKIEFLQTAKAIKEKNGEQIASFKREVERNIRFPQWKCRREGNGAYSMCSTNEGASFFLMKKAVGVIQQKFPSLPKELFQDMDKFIAKQQDYYLSRRISLSEAIKRDPLKLKEHLLDILQCSGKLTENQCYTPDYLGGLISWYKDNQHWDAYICLFKAFKLYQKGAHTHAANNAMIQLVKGATILSQRFFPSTVMLPYLPFFCEVVIAEVIKSKDDDLMLHAIALLNELSGGDDFTVPYDIRDFEQEYGSPYVVTLAQSLGKARKQMPDHRVDSAANSTSVSPQSVSDGKGLHFSKSQQTTKPENLKEPYEFNRSGKYN